MKEHPSQGFMHHWFSPEGATNNDVLATYFHSVALTEYISLQRTAECGQKSVLTFFQICFKLLFKFQSILFVTFNILLLTTVQLVLCTLARQVCDPHTAHKLQRKSYFYDIFPCANAIVFARFEDFRIFSVRLYDCMVCTVCSLQSLHFGVTAPKDAQSWRLHTKLYKFG